MSENDEKCRPHVPHVRDDQESCFVLFALKILFLKDDLLID